MLPEEGYEIDDDDDDDDDDSVEVRQERDLESGQQGKAKIPSSGTHGKELLHVQLSSHTQTTTDVGLVLKDWSSLYETI